MTLPTDVNVDENHVGTKEMLTLENQMQQLIALPPNNTLNPKLLDPSLFAENQNGYEMPSVSSFLRVSDGNVAVIALGLILSSSIGGMVSRWLPSVARWSTVIAGVALMYFGKGKKMIRDLGVGVLLGGLANVFSGLGGSLGGILGGSTITEEPMMEDKVTYGGGDGVYPTNPDRKVFM